MSVTPCWILGESELLIAYNTTVVPRWIFGESVIRHYYYVYVPPPPPPQPDSDASRYSDNIKRSMEKFIKDNLYTTEGIDIKYEGFPFESGATSIDNYINGNMGRILHPEIVSNVGDGLMGGEAELQYSIDTFVKVTGVTSSDLHYQIRDTINKYFYSGVAIKLRDYNSGVTIPAFGNLRIRQIVIDEPKEDEFLRWEYTITGNFMEKRSK